jgi:DnaJ-class molecular chaperone
MEDHYAVLGVPRDGSVEDIRKAFRALALACHPDVAGNEPGAVERFKQVRAAYEVLVDPASRARYDRVTGRGSSRPEPFGGTRGNARDLDLDDLVGGFSVDDFGFGDRPRASRPPPPKPRDVDTTVDIDVATAILGGRVEVDTPSGRVVVSVPGATSSGARLRLRGRGVAGGDLVATLRIVVPTEVDEESRRLLEAFAARNRA